MVAIFFFLQFSLDLNVCQCLVGSETNQLRANQLMISYQQDSNNNVFTVIVITITYVQYSLQKKKINGSITCINHGS